MHYLFSARAQHDARHRLLVLGAFFAVETGIPLFTNLAAPQLSVQLNFRKFNSFELRGEHSSKLHFLENSINECSLVVSGPAGCI